MAYSEFIDEVEQGQVSDVTIQGNNINGHLADGRAFTTYAPNDPGLVNRLEGRGVNISAAPEEESVHPLVSILISWFPMLLLIGVWIFFMRQMRSGGGKAMGFGKSRARLLTEKLAVSPSRMSPASTRRSRSCRRSSSSCATRRNSNGSVA